MSKIYTFGAAVVVTSLSTSVAWAGCIPVPGTPGPVLGLGLPALAVFGYGYKRLRDRRKD